MPRYRVDFQTTISLSVQLDADDEDEAADAAWNRAQEYLSTVYGDSLGTDVVTADASLDGIGADSVMEQS